MTNTVVSFGGVVMTKDEKARLDKAVDIVICTYMDTEDNCSEGAATDAIEHFIRLGAKPLLTTVEELEELPRHSIISYGTGYIYVRLTRGWYFGGADAEPHTSEQLVSEGRGPFTVIQRGPEPE